ncbi:MAG: hypothetical protein ACRBFS_03765 [Aureispira sp.]
MYACATGEHHSTTFHYNNAQKVFVGVLLDQQKNKEGGSDTTWLTFRIKKAYKNCKAGQLVKIQGNAYTTALVKRKSCHLVYAEATLSSVLYCPKLESLKKTTTSRQLDVLDQILVHPLGKEFIEYSQYGRVWSKGYYNQGIPYHGWQYYAYSGELKIKAQYVRGLRSSQWSTYVHTKDSEYEILEQIMTGVYAQKWDDYAVLGIDTSLEDKFRYTLRYLVQEDTVVAPFYYNNPYRTQYRFYREGKRDGLENSFKEDGRVYRTYTFKDGRLHGVYREVLPWAQQEGGYVEVKGSFVADKREEEIHYYYNGQGHFLHKKVIVKKGKIL